MDLRPTDPRSSTTVLVVSDVVASVAHYVDVLGFEEDFLYGDPPTFAGVYRGGVAIHLQDGRRTHRPVGGGCVTLYCGDAMAAHEELAGRGAHVTVPPAPRDYGVIDFNVDDPDGNQLVWSSDLPRDGEGRGA